MSHRQPTTSYRTATVREPVLRCNTQKGMRYFITFRCYGSHIHGAQPGSVDSRHNLPGSRFLDADQKRAEVETEAMTEAPYLLDDPARAIVLEAIKEVCAHRHWTLLAGHVRTNHVHVIVEADARPERAMNDFKSYASRALNKLEPDKERKRWTRHGSTRWLWKDQDVSEAIRYVIDEQGDPMPFFVSGLF
jgi:REP element-mobilizing transposase RayT